MARMILYWPKDASHYDYKTFRFLKREGDVLLEKPARFKSWYPSQMEAIPSRAIKNPALMEPGIYAYEMNEETPYLWPKAARQGMKWNVFRSKLLKLVQARGAAKYRRNELETVQRKAQRMIEKAEQEYADAVRACMEKEEKYFG